MINWCASCCQETPSSGEQLDYMDKIGDLFLDSHLFYLHLAFSGEKNCPNLCNYWCTWHQSDLSQWQIWDFPEAGVPNLQVAPTYDFAKFSQNLYEIERIWTPGEGVCPLCPPPLRSATVSIWCSTKVAVGSDWMWWKWYICVFRSHWSVVYVTRYTQFCTNSVQKH